MKDEWVTVVQPSVNARFYLHVKYLFLSSNDNEHDREVLTEEFQDLPINLSYYLKVFSVFFPTEIPTEMDKTPEEFHFVSASEAKTELALRTAICVLGVVFFVCVWNMLSVFKGVARIFFGTSISSFLFITYPSTQSVQRELTTSHIFVNSQQATCTKCGR